MNVSRPGLGYNQSFLGQFRVPLPTLANLPASNAFVVDVHGSTEIRYMHFSITMHTNRKFAIYTAHNVKGYDIKRMPRVGWEFDSRLPRSSQVGNDVYRNNPYDRGHLVRRIAVNWGTYEEASQANADTFNYTNAVLQHQNFNQDEWLALEDWVLALSRRENKKLCVFTGPVFTADDTPYRGVHIPRSFWKVIVMEKDLNKFSVTAFKMNQTEMSHDRSGRANLQLGLYQVSLRSIELVTGLDFGTLKSYQDRRFRMSNVQNVREVHITSADDICI